MTITITGSRGFVSTYPKRLLESGFVFDFETMEEILDDLI